MGYHGVRRGYATLDMVTTKNLDEADDLKPPSPAPFSPSDWTLDLTAPRTCF
jgi:hypothetical protein